MSSGLEMVSLLTHFLPQLEINSICYSIHRYNFITLDINNLYSQQTYSPCPEYKLVSLKTTSSNNHRSYSQIDGIMFLLCQKSKMGPLPYFQAAPWPVHQPALPVVLLQGPEHAGRHRVQVLLRQHEQAGLPVLGRDETRPLFWAWGHGDWHGVDEDGHRDDLLQGHQGLGGK